MNWQPQMAPPEQAPLTPHDWGRVHLLRRGNVAQNLLVGAIALWIAGGFLDAGYHGSMPMGGLLTAVASVLVLVVCTVVLTGPVYYPPKQDDSLLKPWSFWNKVAAVIILLTSASHAVSMFAG